MSQFACNKGIFKYKAIFTVHVYQKIPVMYMQKVKDSLYTYYIRYILSRLSIYKRSRLAPHKSNKSFELDVTLQARTMMNVS